MKEENVIAEKTKAFAVRIVKLSRYLREEEQEYVLSEQVLRSGTGIGANVREAIYGQSKRDFIAKMSISLKEAVETEYWLELLYETGYLKEKEYRSIREDSSEIAKILTAVVKSSKNCEM